MACPDDNTKDDLIRRGDVIAEIKRIADDHENMAVFGEPEQARIRDGMANALRRAQYAVAFMPKADKDAVEDWLSGRGSSLDSELPTAADVRGILKNY